METPTPAPETGAFLKGKNSVFIGIALVGLAAVAIMFASHGSKQAEEQVAKEDAQHETASSEQEEVSIVSPVATIPVSVYFFRNVGNDEQLVRVERRIPQTPAVARGAITELLKGPSGTGAEQGLSTALPTGVVLNDITISAGEARVDFNSTLSQVAGSARVKHIRQQIEQTLLQFPTVSRVTITVNGLSEGVLEP